MAKKKEATLSEQLQQLETITDWFEQEGINLDEAVKKFEKGLEIAQDCKTKLTEVENKIEKLQEKYEGVLEEKEDSPF